MVRRGQNLRGPYGYVITQVYRKVPITINPAHRSRASQHPWLPERSTKLAVGASGTHRTPTTNRASTVAFYDPWWHTGMGILAPPSQGIVCIFIWRRIPSEIISHPLRNYFAVGTRGSFLAFLGISGFSPTTKMPTCHCS